MHLKPAEVKLWTLLQGQIGKGALSALYPWLKEQVNEVPLGCSKLWSVTQNRKENENEGPVRCSVGHKALVGPFTAEVDGGQGEGVTRKRRGQELDEGPLTSLYLWSEQKSLKHRGA